MKKNENFKCTGCCRIKAIILAVVVLVIVVAATMFFRGGEEAGNGKVMAKVNGKKIYESQLNSKLNEILSGNPFATENSADLNQLPEEAIKTLVEDIAIGQELDKRVKKSGVCKDEEIQKKVREYEKQLSREEFLKRMVAEEVTDEAVRARYDDLVKEIKGKDELRIKHILVGNQEEAESVIRNIKSKRKTFEEEARKKSLDKTTAEKGGDLGYVMREYLVKEFADVAFVLKQGEISRPVRTQFGWHVIKVEDRRPATVAEFDKIKDRVRKQLEQEALQSYLSEISDDLEIELVKSDDDMDIQITEDESTSEDTDPAGSKDAPSAEKVKEKK